MHNNFRDNHPSTSDPAPGGLAEALRKQIKNINSLFREPLQVVAGNNARSWGLKPNPHKLIKSSKRERKSWMHLSDGVVHQDGGLALKIIESWNNCGTIVYFVNKAN